MSDDKYYTGSEFPIVSKSEMKRVATLDPIAAAEELDRLRKEVERLNSNLDIYQKLARVVQMRCGIPDAAKACRIILDDCKAANELLFVRSQR